ncbi:MAG: glycine--tRNA ligase subunit beta [Candidatus Marinimicrobia bacterium]|nr:glycine--tRNA ligase subunit beta [Candidatus Neomarinimicrobiota bacterium]
MAELLLELLSEEIPARMQTRAADNLARLICEGLEATGLKASSVGVLAGPRRIAVVVGGLPVSQPDTLDERKGPQIGAPNSAIQGFLKGAGLKKVEDAEVRELPKGKFYFAVTKRKGRATSDVLKGVIETALSQLPWPKSMRWGEKSVRWVRPLQAILCILDGTVVPIVFAGVKASDTTRGHRFLAPKAIKIRNFANYKAKLEKAFVIADQVKRSEIITEGLCKLADKESLVVTEDPGLLAEVVGLVEWPVPLLGTIDAEFMDVPPEVLISAMRKHQKYFALAKKNGQLANRFGVVVNIITEDGGKAIVEGNERVLRARLSDAKFFWEQDCEHRLDSRLNKLEERVFQNELGTVRDKVDRIVKCSAFIADYVPGAGKTEVARAALLCKADLSTGMVGEFPDLQGTMGRYYALHDKEQDSVAEAIADHYSPQGPSDVCPTAPVSVVTALADKLDSLVGFFAIDAKPTGSKDPYAMRRAALGVIRLILENKLRLPLMPAFKRFLGAYRNMGHVDSSNLAESLMDFFADRLKSHLRDRGVRHDHVSAVFSLGGEDDLVRLLAHVGSLAKFLRSDDGANLLVAYRRSANIVLIEEKKDGTTYDGEVVVEDLGAVEAGALLESIESADILVQQALDKEDFAAAIVALATLRKPVDIFFDKVTVNTNIPSQRLARLRLLTRIVSVMGRVADFSKIEGSKTA